MKNFYSIGSSDLLEKFCPPQAYRKPNQPVAQKRIEKYFCLPTPISSASETTSPHKLIFSPCRVNLPQGTPQATGFRLSREPGMQVDLASDSTAS